MSQEAETKRSCDELLPNEVAMRRRSFVTFFASLVVCVGASSAHAVTYTATLLHPFNYRVTSANGVFGEYQGGHGQIGAPGSTTHAFLWSGTAASIIDLNPVGFNHSWAFAASRSKQVGVGDSPTTGGFGHAILWNGSAATAVDLNPAGFTKSEALGIDGGVQVAAGNITAVRILLAG